MSKEIEHIIKEKFDDFSVAPSADLFDKIQAKSTAKKRRFIWIWSAAVIALLGTGIGLYMNSTSKECIVAPKTEGSTTPNDIAQHPVLTEKITKNEEIITQEEDLASNETIKTPTANHSNSNHTLVVNDKEQRSDDTRTNDNIDLETPIVNEELANLYEDLENKAKEKSDDGLTMYIGNRPIALENKDILKTRESTKKKEPESPSTHKADTAGLDNQIIVAKNETSEDKTKTDEKSESKKLPIHRLLDISKWSISATTGFGHGGRVLSGDKDYIALRNSTETILPSYTFDVRALYQINPTWNIQMGLNRTTRHERFDFTTEDVLEITSRQEKRTETIVHPVLGTYTRDYLVTVNDTSVTPGIPYKSSNRYTFYSVPIEIEGQLYQFERITLLAKGGILAGIYNQIDGLMLSTEGEATPIADLPHKTASIHSATVGLGIAYQINKKCSFTFYPEGRVSLNSTFSGSTPITQRETGLYTQVGFRIKL